MRKTSWLAWGIVLGVTVVTAGIYGCSSDSDTKTSGGTSRKGERCQNTGDCVGGLACLPNGSSGGGTCVVGLFQIAPLAKECARVQCQTVADCCTNLGSGCDELKKECDAEVDAGFGNQVGGVCDNYKSECGCDDNSKACESGQCISKCIDDTSCRNKGAGLTKCLGGKCGQCGTDDDCKTVGSNYTCVNAVCQPPCQNDGDCTDNTFDRCLNGKCIAGGCQNNRECVAATGNVESTCGTDGKCIVPCQTDLECGSPTNYQLFSCIQNKCQFVGCDDDKECELLYVRGGTITTSSGVSSSGTSGTSGTTGSGPQTHYVCRDKTAK
jgi:hypothetical protein